ncbi:hypothetical protein DAEQUDRAFT_211975 [Daedalea quercina L-15889]|uniref:Uncharacterized protein n=1 Tax=Daedalea quercina L-15889 TaxID=1314783 RepID=A0A165RB84_9APHY|nr:hypothetical protein DAEQUDRAFT_211975 [Daedalea quercina L-15889]
MSVRSPRFLGGRRPNCMRRISGLGQFYVLVCRIRHYCQSSLALAVGFSVSFFRQFSSLSGFGVSFDLCLLSFKSRRWVATQWRFFPYLAVRFALLPRCKNPVFVSDCAHVPRFRARSTTQGSLEYPHPGRVTTLAPNSLPESRSASAEDLRNGGLVGR